MDSENVPALARSTVDRAAHRRTDQEWLTAAWTRARVLVVDGSGKTLVNFSGPSPELVFVTAEFIAAEYGITEYAPGEDRMFLGEDYADQPPTPYFAVRAELPMSTGEEVTPAGLREVGADLSARDAGLLVSAVALANWLDASAFSPRTGASTRARQAGWVREADDGSGPSFPRTDPAMIVLVHDGVAGDEGLALLGRGHQWQPNRYSTLAGFVEAGESAEAAVVREVAEESGVTVWEVRYVASQPWPMPSSLMLGFTAIGDPAQPIRLGDDELADARWFSRAEIRSKVAADELRLPMRVSIAHQLVERWLSGDC